MAVKGFACETEDVAGITTSLDKTKPVILGGNTSRDAYAAAIPQGAYLDHVEIKVLQTAVGAVTPVLAMLAYDSAGDEVCWSGTITMTAALTTASTYFGDVAVQRWFRAPSVQTTAGKLYLFLKTNAGTVTLKKARLHWVDNLGA